MVVGLERQISAILAEDPLEYCFRSMIVDVYELGRGCLRCITSNGIAGALLSKDLTGLGLRGLYHSSSARD